jgi:hypothetical protein
MMKSLYDYLPYLLASRFETSEREAAGSRPGLIGHDEGIFGGRPGLFWREPLPPQSAPRFQHWLNCNAATATSHPTHKTTRDIFHFHHGAWRSMALRLVVGGWFIA